VVDLIYKKVELKRIFLNEPMNLAGSLFTPFLSFPKNSSFEIVCLKRGESSLQDHFSTNNTTAFELEGEKTTSTWNRSVGKPGFFQRGNSQLTVFQPLKMDGWNELSSWGLFSGGKC